MPNDKDMIGVASLDGTWVKADEVVKTIEAGTAAAPLRRNRVEAKKPIDDLTGFEVDEGFEPFQQRNDVFSRAQWDDEVRSEQAKEFWAAYIMPNARARKADGYSQRDYALRNAAWHFTKAFATLKSGTEGRHEGFNDTFTPAWARLAGKVPPR